MHNPKEWSKGDVRPDGKVFWKYHKTSKNGEYWVTREQFDAKKRQDRANSRRRRGWPEHRLYEEMTEIGRRISEGRTGSMGRERKSRIMINRLKARTQREVGRQICRQDHNPTGCSASTLAAHLESKFQDGMSWDNYGEWHVDHILPMASFNLLDPIERAKANHYTNLQPLWAEENFKKGSREP